MHKVSDNSGTTLVELLVAATIMALVIAAVVAVIRSGSELEVNDNHRRVARSILTSWFENNFTAEYFDNIEPGTIDTSDTVDGRDGTPIIGSLHVDITADTQNISGSDIPILQAEAKIFWQEFGGVADSLILTKQIADLE